MTDVKKFLFDTHDFTLEGAEEKATYTEDQLILAKEQSFALGRAEGLREEKEQQEARIAALLQKIFEGADVLIKAEERREIEKSADSVALALRVVKKLLPQFSHQYALPEIERVIVQSMTARKDEPRIAVTIPTAHLEALKGRVDAFAIEKGYAGKVILLADDALALTDCRVEWTDGGAERLYEKIFSQIEGAFLKAVAGVETVLKQDAK